jgi:hypothetical protein
LVKVVGVGVVGVNDRKPLADDGGHHNDIASVRFLLGGFLEVPLPRNPSLFFEVNDNILS